MLCKGVLLCAEYAPGTKYAPRADYAAGVAIHWVHTISEKNVYFLAEIFPC